MIEIPSNVRALMAGRVNTLEKLIVIVELGKRPELRITTPELTTVVPFEMSNLRETLKELSQGQIIRIEDQIIELTPDADINELLRVYDEDPIGTVTTLTNISMNRIRSMAHAFADAFDLRKKK